MDPYANPLAVDPSQPSVIQNPSPEQVSDLSGQWKNWMANENNRAAMMQFGVSLMQPMGFGQNAAGHIGRAIGSAGEAVDRREADARKQQELDSKQELRTSQAMLAESRAANAGQGVGRQADRLAFERERLGWRSLFDSQRLNQRNAQMYDRYVQNANSENATLPAAQRKPIMTRDEYIRYHGLDQGGASPTSSDPNDQPISSPSAPAPTAGASPPTSSLKEGVVTQFRNGQAWTLRNGQPVQVK